MNITRGQRHVPHRGVGAPTRAARTIDVGTVTDPAAWVADNYTLRFTSPTDWVVEDDTLPTPVQVATRHRLHLGADASSFSVRA